LPLAKRKGPRGEFLGCTSLPPLPKQPLRSLYAMMMSLPSEKGICLGWEHLETTEPDSAILNGGLPLFSLIAVSEALHHDTGNQVMIIGVNIH
jgi:hypothetical protein